MATPTNLLALALLTGIAFGQGSLGDHPIADHPQRFSAPVPIYRAEPEYTEEARNAKIEGAVRVKCVIDENGIPTELAVARSLDKGLDEKAIEAVQQWRFKPARKDGKPVPAPANIEVTFRLPQ